MRTRGALRAILMICAGLALSAYSLLAMSSFLRTARPVLMMGSRIQPDGAMVQSIAAVIFLAALFIAGAVLVLLSVKNLIKSFKQ